ncbi:MAG: response regulator transcription factor [Chloroflexi bacterium]|uniref:Response regulator transcription factor n=1 Tax=Candidatus Chlorohelix allophototropha TaxID=3003348 RepID=A0A8T7LTY1_9CHLR|nr:response regulator transcription factor [Chloroflexota bacterium]WJW66191.1 response regulator transcription factor [Chloroflexota bacterium L227-S17]
MYILVVEDEEKLVKLIKRVLEEERYQVDTALDGAQGLEMALIGSYDLIILDVMMPHVTGLEICKSLRDEKSTVPILMLTALDAIQDRVQGLDVGADDYLTKPFAFDELLARIRALLRRRINPEDPVNTILKVEDLELDLSKHEARRHGKHIELTSKEFALLEYLMHNKGQVLSRDQIINHVWEYDFDATSNVVDIYIHYLRNKIDGHFSRKLIKTVRGLGYSIRVD